MSLTDLNGVSYRTNASNGETASLAGPDFREVSVNLKKFDDIIERIEDLRFLQGKITDLHDQLSHEKRLYSSKNNFNSNRPTNKAEQTIERVNVTAFDVFTSQRAPSYHEENYEQDSLDRSDLVEYGPIKTRLPSPRGHPYCSDWSMRSSVKSQQFAAMNLGKQQQQRDQQEEEERQQQQQQWSDGLLFVSSLGQTSPCDRGTSGKEGNAICEGFPLATAGDCWLSQKDEEKSVFDGSGQRPLKEVTPIPSIVVERVHEGSEASTLAGKGTFQGGQVFSDASNNSIPSPTMRTWADSPISCYNVVNSGPNSRCSSRAQSPGSGMQLECQLMSSNVAGSPLGSPQVAIEHMGSGFMANMPQSLASPSSSSQSYGDTPSPSNYQTPISQRIEEQLHEDLACFSIWGTFNNEQRSANNGETVTGFDSNELQLVEEVLRDLGGKYERTEEAQVVPNSHCYAPSFEEQTSALRMLENNAKRVSPDAMDHRQNFDVSSSFGSRVPAISSSPNDLSYSFTGDQQSCNYQQSNCHETRHYEYSGEINSQMERNLHVDQFNRSVPSLVGLEGLSNENFGRLCASPCSSTMTKQGRRRCFSGSELPLESTFNDFQIPEMVTSFKSRRTRKPAERNIVPWPSLNLPSVQASERLKEGLNPKDVERAMISLLKRPVEELARADEDGDTMLMCLVGNPEELARKKKYLVPLVERLSNVKGALSVTNNRGEDALYLAAMNCPDMSYIAGYLAATMLQKGIDISQRLYHTRGDTLIHSVAARGDSHGEVLAELLALKTVQGNAVFDLSKRNYDGRTALHVAVESHDATGKGPKAVATVRLLLDNGADPNVKETKCGDTALHMASALTCDPALVKVLLCKVGATAVNATNYNYNTPLHMAAAVSTSVPLERQKEVCWHLIQAGAQSNIQNRQGKTPLALVSAARKDAIKRIFYKRC